MKIISTTYYISLFLIIITTFVSTHAIDTIITSQQILRDNGTTLISSGGTFELGFYSPENSKNRYVGIWYKKIPVTTVVWVANRNNPLTDRSGTLKVVEPGIVVLANGTNGTVWSTNTSSGVQSPVAQLLDSGNLVVKDANDNNPENFLWQSFDYPTDTFLPGMRLGVNFVTGLDVFITSPRSSNDPASGDYRFRCDPTGYPQNVIEKGTSVRFKSGPWNGVRYSGSLNLNKNNVFRYGMVINKNEVYYYNELVNETVYMRLILSEGGVGQRWVWNDQTQSWIVYNVFPVDNCDIYNVCGPHGSCNTGSSSLCGCLNKFKPKDPARWDRGDWSNGCIRSSTLDCQKGDAFIKYSGIKLPDTKDSLSEMSILTLEECRVLCSKNCNCTAYASPFIDGTGSGCLIWFGELLDIREMAPGQDIYIRMASSELDEVQSTRNNSTEPEGRKRNILIVTLSLVIGIVLLGLGLFLYSQKRNKRKTVRLGLNNVESHNDLELPLFDLSTITKATDSFSFHNKLGEGGFGPVYKGRLEEGQEIAVKRLSRNSHQGVDEFKNEVICIAKLQHRNLVKLLGWCNQGEEMMLVYEYMANKSLDLILFDQTKRILLDWLRRFNVINGIARALMYLHQDSRLRVIHRDLKASNILLDSDMNPKISDFGLARTFGGNETGAKTSRLVGTYGYISPEYATYGLFSVKSDVFSFGVIVLEIVSGKRNTELSQTNHHLNLLGLAWMLYKEGRSLELVDSYLRNSYNLSEVLRSIHIGLLCVQARPEDRPTMSSVVPMLGNNSVLPEANQPGFFTGIDALKFENPDLSKTGCSTNTMSITLLEAR